ncbi:hypothetical protein T484DRAFT_1953090 [Baffinella frigidus]|nr:hypothetical protein T484DRAFT_1953090 [Cryptophyta sp. CCMP2293]
MVRTNHAAKAALLLMVLMHNCATLVEGFAPPGFAAAKPRATPRENWRGGEFLPADHYSVLGLGEENKKDGPGGSEESYGDWAKNVAYSAVAAGAAGAVLVAPSLAGFGAEGVVAGSYAAAWQSSIGNVGASTAFSTLQSIGATYTYTSAVGTALVIGGTVGAGYLAYTYFTEEESANGA